MTQSFRSLLRLSVAAAALVAVAAPLSAAPAFAAGAPAGPGALQLAYDAQVQRIQRGLNRLGYDAGPTDGLMGSRTRTAIEAYQRDHDLLVTGQASTSLADHIRDQVREERTEQRETAQGEVQEIDRQAVLRAQSDLRRLGYDIPVVSGQVDAETQEALRAYQRDNDLIVDGRLTPELAAHIRGRTSAGTTIEDRETVRSVQQALNDRGYDAGPADGIMGSSTRDAIRTFQSDAGLPLTGRVSPELMTELGLAAAAGTAAGATASESSETTAEAGPVTVVQDSFADGNYTRDPRWEVVAGSWRVTDGGALTSDVPIERQTTSPQQLGPDVIKGILGSALGLQQGQGGRQLAAIHTRADLANAFSLSLRLSAAGEPAVLNVGPYQGNNVGQGYRLEARTGDDQPLHLLAITGSGTTVIGTSDVDIRFDDGAKHRLDWRRDTNGLQTIEFDGQVVLQVLDQTYRDPFDGVSLINAGGTWSVDSVEAQSLAP